MPQLDEMKQSWESYRCFQGLFSQWSSLFVSSTRLEMFLSAHFHLMWAGWQKNKILLWRRCQPRGKAGWLLSQRSIGIWLHLTSVIVLLMLNLWFKGRRICTYSLSFTALSCLTFTLVELKSWESLNLCGLEIVFKWQWFCALENLCT